MPIELGGPPSAGPLELRVAETGDEVVLELDARQAEARFVFDAPRLWSPDDPYLYHVQAVLTTPAGRDEVVAIPASARSR